MRFICHSSAPNYRWLAIEIIFTQDCIVSYQQYSDICPEGRHSWINIHVCSVLLFQLQEATLQGEVLGSVTLLQFLLKKLHTKTQKGSETYAKVGSAELSFMEGPDMSTHVPNDSIILQDVTVCRHQQQHMAVLALD